MLRQAFALYTAQAKKWLRFERGYLLGSQRERGRGLVQFLGEYEVSGNTRCQEELSGTLGRLGRYSNNFDPSTSRRKNHPDDFSLLFAALLTGRMPVWAASPVHGVFPARGSERPDRFAVLGSEYAGSIVGVSLDSSGQTYAVE